LVSESVLKRSIDLIGPEETMRLLGDTPLSEYRDNLPKQYENATALDLGEFIWEELNARPEQRVPKGDWDTWFLRAGRGFGKTRVGSETTISTAEWAKRLIDEGKLRPEEAMLYVVGGTAADVRDVMVRGPAGILRCSPPWFPATYKPSERKIIWPGGVHAMLFSAQEPDRLRGPQGIFAWCDELPAWKYAEESWDNLQMGLRLGPNPRAMVTATPRPTELIRGILAAAGTVVTRGQTRDNSENLSAKAIEKLYAKYGGTRLGRQELLGEVLDDNPNALWKMADIDRLRLRPKPGQIMPEDPGWSEADEPNFKRLMAAIQGRKDMQQAILDAHGIELERIMIGVDPAVSNNEKSDETGIVVFGIGMCSCRGAPQMHGFVLEDVSGIYSPAEWGGLLVRVYNVWRANKIIAEINNGGALVEANLRATDGGANLPYDGVHAKRGKLVRAEPIAGLTEQSKLHHVSTFPKLEDELTGWDPIDLTAMSPNRLDGFVYAASELMLEPGHVTYSKPTRPLPGRRI
jgi:phage terminase large subunit-like protein